MRDIIYMIILIHLQTPLIQKFIGKNIFSNVDDNFKDDGKISKKIKVLEIGSNDGYLLSQFKKNDYSVLGIDASKKMCQLANKKK